MPGRERVKVGQGTVPPEPSRWMNPLAKIKWRKIILARETTAEVEGKKFTLDYKRRKGFVLIRPIKGFAPMGWVDLDRVRREDGDWIVGD